jgi:hypothetical protein
MRQLSMFTPAQIAGMRDRTASRNYSPGREQFRHEHERHRAWGLARRHGERLRRLHPPTARASAPAQHNRIQGPSAPRASAPATPAPAPARQPTRVVPAPIRIRSAGPSRTAGPWRPSSPRRHTSQDPPPDDSPPSPEPEPAGSSAETFTARRCHGPRSSTGNNRGRPGIGIRCHSHRPAPSEPISINLQVNTTIPATSPHQGEQLHDRTRFPISGRPP